MIVIPGISGYVLAGGLSSRMGQDKALLRVDGSTLIETAMAKLQQICGNASILCGTAERGALLSRFGTVVLDTVPHLGPLGGMVAALAGAEAEWVLILPVDVPFLPVEVLRQWVREGLSSEAGVCCFRAQEVIQPLPVLARRAIGPALQRALDNGEQRLRPALRGAVESCYGEKGFHITEVEYGLAGADLWFRNLNTPSDLLHANVDADTAG